MFVVLGVVFAAAAQRYPAGTWAQPGPGYFRLMLSFGLALLGAVILFKALTFETEGGAPIGALAWRPLAAMVAAVLIFGMGLPRLGLLPSAALAMAVASLAGGGFTWRERLVTTAALGAVAWLLGVGLRLPIASWPRWIGA